MPEKAYNPKVGPKFRPILMGARSQRDLEYHTNKSNYKNSALHYLTAGEREERIGLNVVRDQDTRFLFKNTRPDQRIYNVISEDQLDYSRPHPRSPDVPLIHALKRRQIAKKLLKERQAKLNELLKGQV